MVAKADKPVSIDLSSFKLNVCLKPGRAFTLHFNTPSRRFYLSLLGFLVSHMKRSGKITSVALEEHLDLLGLLNETVGESAGSSGRANLLGRIYRKWKNALPDLEHAPLFRVLGRTRDCATGLGKPPSFSEAELDHWANLFDYTGSEENVRLRFSLDRIGLGLDDVLISWEGHCDLEAWERFVSGLRNTHPARPEADARNDAQAPGPAPGTPGGPRPARAGLHVRRAAIAAAFLLLVASAAMMAGKMRSPALSGVVPEETRPLPLPDRPSLAVLPFANMSGDPGQDYLVDGITENIIRALSSEPGLFVIDRHSSFTYKGKAAKVQEVAEAFGVRYVLEGSVLKSGDRIRVTAQLMDALNGRRLWTERYDDELKDIFAFQDDVTTKILQGMQVKLTRGEGLLHSDIPKNLEGYLKILQGVEYLRKFNIEDNNRARRIAEECIALEPDFGTHYRVLGIVHLMDYWLGSTKDPAQSLTLAIEYLQKALDLSKHDKGRNLARLGNLYAIKRDYDKAIEMGEQAITMVPNSAGAHVWLAMSLNYAGRPDEALPLFEKGMRLNPVAPAFYYQNRGNAYRLLGRFEEAVDMYKKTLQLRPNSLPAHWLLAATYALMGLEQQAQAEAAEVLRINPKFSVAYVAKILPYKRQADNDQIVDGLRKAGLK